MIRINGSERGYDAVVIGGGPAGTTLATFLSRKGHRCLVLNGTQFPRYHIGESLIPNTYGVLDRLGLLPQLKRSHFPVKHSVRFVSPAGDESDPFYFSDSIVGEAAQTWQVERSEFDQLCLENARQAGVEVRLSTRVHRVIFDDGRATGVVSQHKNDDPVETAARVVVDASGRGTVIGNQLELKEDVPLLRKSAVWGYYRGAQRRAGIDAGETTVFTIRDRGWFWYIPLPNDVVSVGIVASPDYLLDEGIEFESVYVREIDRCRPLHPFLRNAERVGPVRGIRRLAYINRQTAGDGWVMIGDAAGFLDPIYSSGLYLALASAELASKCVHEALVWDDVSAERLGDFSRALWNGVDIVWRLIHAFYNPHFSFREFTERFPQHRDALIHCLVGDVVGRDMSTMLAALAELTPPPPRLK
jgi:flavin-dependent dehydrogenase